MGSIPTYTIRLSSKVVSDHLARLYNVSDDRRFAEHVDIADALIWINNRGKQTSDIQLTAAAVEQLIDDLDYQIEFAYGDAYRQQCRRALARVKAVK